MGLDTARHDWSELTHIRGTRQMFLCILNAISLFVILPNTAPFISCPYVINLLFNWNTFIANVIFSKFRLMSWARIQAPEANCLGLNLGYATYYLCNLWHLCLLHWQVGSLPLAPLGKPFLCLLESCSPGLEVSSRQPKTGKRDSRGGWNMHFQ